MIWNDLGNEYAAAGDLTKAMSALQRAHAVDPDYPLPLYNLGKHILDRYRELAGSGTNEPGMLAEAIDYFCRSLGKDPNNADCHRNLAIAYQAAGDTLKASTHVMEALRLGR